MPEKLKGYAEAEKIDYLISKLVKKYPITEETAPELLRLARTVGTTCAILEAMCCRKLTGNDNLFPIIPDVSCPLCELNDQCDKNYVNCLFNPSPVKRR